MANLVESNSANFSVGRQGHTISRIYFHRTGNAGHDTAIGEANYFHSHVLKASAGCFIDLDGSIVQSVRDNNTSWSVDNWDENLISYSIEFCGVNGSKLSAKQIATAIAFIKADPLLKAVANHRLSIAEIAPRKVGGYGNHKDVTTAYKIAGGHTDYISEAEIKQILTEVYA